MIPSHDKNIDSRSSQKEVIVRFNGVLPDKSRLGNQETSERYAEIAKSGQETNTSCSIIIRDSKQDSPDSGFHISASALLMAVIMVVVYNKGLRGFGGIVIGGIVGLDIFFLAFISGASMNPARSLAPALISGVLDNLWLYWSATFIGTSTVILLVRKKFAGNFQ